MRGPNRANRKPQWAAGISETMAGCWDQRRGGDATALAGRGEDGGGEGGCSRPPRPPPAQPSHSHHLSARPHRPPVRARPGRDCLWSPGACLSNWLGVWFGWGWPVLTESRLEQVGGGGRGGKNIIEDVLGRELREAACPLTDPHRPWWAGLAGVGEVFGGGRCDEPAGLLRARGLPVCKGVHPPHHPSTNATQCVRRHLTR